MIRFVRDLIRPHRAPSPNPAVGGLYDAWQRAHSDCVMKAEVMIEVADALDRLTQAPDRMIRAGAIHEELTGYATQLRDAARPAPDALSASSGAGRYSPGSSPASTRGTCSPRRRG